MLFRVGNFNLRNLTLPNFEFYENLSYSPQEYEEKIQWTATQLQKMNADIVSFQEVFHYQPLCEACERSGMYSNVLPISPKTEESEPRVGLISRFPIEEWSLVYEFPKDCQTPEFQSFRRPLIKARLRLPNGAPLIFFAIHLKSRRAMFHENSNPFDAMDIAKGTARSLLYRAREAVALRRVLLETINTNTIVAGDFNDASQSVSSQIIRGPRPPYGASEEQKEQFLRQRLCFIGEEVNRTNLRNVQYSYIYDGQYETVDHILVSHHFHKRNPNAKGNIVYLQNFNDHLIDRAQEWLNQPKYSSDHGQSVATLSLDA